MDVVATILAVFLLWPLLLAWGGLFSVILYALPSIIALCRWHRNWFPILILNLSLGWTVVGWFCALAWSFTSQREHRARNP